MSSQLRQVSEAVSEKLSLATEHRRILLAVAGAPGSGKSTFSQHLCDTLREQGVCTEVMPMDGFHYDNVLLKKKNLLSLKGAPNTFDVSGLYHLITRVKERSNEAVAIPLFDRELELSRASARLICQEVEVVIVEGNYLLCDVTPWDTLSGLFDLRVLLQVSESVLRERLLARWRGLGLDESEVIRKVETNDLPNGKFVVEHSRAVDMIICD